MARSRLGRARALLFLLAGSAAVFLAAAGPALGAHARTYQGCRSAHNSNFHGAKCRRGKYHRGPGSAHLLFYAANGGRCPDATLEPSTHNVARVRAATLCLVNRERAAHGEGALHWNIHLIAAAQAHTESMAFGDYFEHVGPHGQTPLMRIRRTGYISSSRVGFEIAENIGYGTLWLGTPKSIVATWMASPGHRANILDRHFRDTGIGVSPHTGGLAHGQSGGLYTQDFGVIVG
jgi:uncharacterized protein YkwD